MDEIDETERQREAAMEIIAKAGTARSCAFAAIHRAKAFDFAGAAEQLDEAERYAMEAHKVHTELLVREAGGQQTDGGLLVAHAQDHFMMATLAQELTRELRVPVIDGVSAAVKMVESLVALGLATSKHGDLAFPEKKALSVSLMMRNNAVFLSPSVSSCSSSYIVRSRSSWMSKGANLAPQEMRMDFAVFPETNCQGLFHQIHKKSTKKVPEAPYGS